ncbi:hypothetical protein [Nocardia pseudovaccinii]|nr:hypothetical protein [Nocardia pseudovaccinii]
MAIAELAAEVFADNRPQTHDQQVEVTRAVAGPHQLERWNLVPVFSIEP